MAAIIVTTAVAVFIGLTFVAWRRYLWAGQSDARENLDTCPYSLTDAFGEHHLANVPHQKRIRWLTEVFSRSAERFPDLVALQIPHTGESLTFAELEARAENIAAALSSFLTGPDQVVAVAMSITFLLPLCLLGRTAQPATKFAENQCLTVEVSKGEIGEGKLRYCDNGTDQEIYLSGEMDIRPTDRNEKNAADLVALKKIMREFKKRDKGIFRVVTNNAGGGETDWHQNLIMAVEDACIKDCQIITEIKGRCESACNQLHITCVSNARTILHNAAKTCEHATTDEDNSKCNKRDPLVPGERDLCGAQVAVNEYEERCGELTKGRHLNIDAVRKKQIYEFIESLARKGVFDTTKLTCTPLPWAETSSTAACGVNMR